MVLYGVLSFVVVVVVVVVVFLSLDVFFSSPTFTLTSQMSISITP